MWVQTQCLTFNVKVPIRSFHAGLPPPFAFWKSVSSQLEEQYGSMANAQGKGQPSASSSSGGGLPLQGSISTLGSVLGGNVGLGGGAQVRCWLLRCILCLPGLQRVRIPSHRASTRNLI